MIARILVQIIVTFARFESSNSSNNGADCRFSGYSCSPFSLPSLPLFLSLFNLFLPLLLPSRWKGPRRISEGLVESRKLCWLAHTKSKEASQVIARPTGR